MSQFVTCLVPIIQALYTRNLRKFTPDVQDMGKTCCYIQISQKESKEFSAEGDFRPGTGHDGSERDYR